MANPNIVGVTSILGKTDQIPLTSTSAISILNNAASSGTILKINSIYICNEDGAGNAAVTIAIYSQDDLGGSAENILSTVVVPADASLVAVDKNAPLYLEEDKSIAATASAANDLVVTISYEIISAA